MSVSREPRSPDSSTLLEPGPVQLPAPRHDHGGAPRNGRRPEGLRIFVVHPHEMVRRGLKAMMSELDTVGWTWAFRDAGAAQRRLGLARTDVVICPCDVTDGVRELVAACRENQVLVLSLIETPDEQHLAVASEMPADGFLLTTDITAESLEDALARLLRGEMPLPASLSRWLLGRLRNRSAGRAERPYFLTSRELETLQLLAQGFSNKQIARALGISQHGAKRHVANVIAKLNCPNRTLAVALALREGLIDEPADARPWSG